jgi:hypothetical protein
MSGIMTPRSSITNHTISTMMDNAVNMALYLPPFRRFESNFQFFVGKIETLRLKIKVEPLADLVLDVVAI